MSNSSESTLGDGHNALVTGWLLRLGDGDETRSFLTQQRDRAVQKRHVSPGCIKNEYFSLLASCALLPF